jgi:hypothetical protein
MERAGSTHSASARPTYVNTDVASYAQTPSRTHLRYTTRNPGEPWPRTVLFNRRIYHWPDTFDETKYLGLPAVALPRIDTGSMAARHSDVNYPGYRRFAIIYLALLAKLTVQASKVCYAYIALTKSEVNVTFRAVIIQILRSYKTWHHSSW